MRALVAAAVAIGISDLPAMADGNWTGGYVGGQIGNLDVNGTGTADGDDTAYGLFAGYDLDLGQWVLGGEVEIDFTDLNLSGAASVDSVARLKLRAGYEFGQVLGYVTGGAARLDSTLGNDTGGFLGVGLAYRLNGPVTIGGEVLYDKFDNINGSGIDADATSVSLRAAFRF